MKSNLLFGQVTNFLQFSSFSDISSVSSFNRVIPLSRKSPLNLIVLSESTMFDLFSKNVFLFTGIATVISTGVYVLWGPSQSKKSKSKDLCPGLQNLGNTCFLNVILQSWASCNSVITWLSDFLTRHEHQSRESLAVAVHKTLSVLNNKNPTEDDTYSPVNVLNALRYRRWVIPHDEQDSHELFHVMTQTLDEDTARYPRVVSLFDKDTLESSEVEYQSDKIALSRTKGLLPVLPHREMEQPFRGLLASQMECQKCGHRNPIKYDAFDSLSLNLPTVTMGGLTLERLLQRYISEETVHDIECTGCSKNRKPVVKTTFKRKLTIGKLPRCLCIHIQRTHWLDNGVQVKRYDNVAFPQVLHMDGFVYSKSAAKDRKQGLVGGRDSRVFGFQSQSSSSGVNLLRALNYDGTTQSGLHIQKPSTQTTGDINHNSPEGTMSYKLSAVISHLGDVYSGHFICYRRSPQTVEGTRHNERWLCCSDTSVMPCYINDVLSSEAYMLLYERS